MGREHVELVASLGTGLFAVWVNLYIPGFLTNFRVPYLVLTTVDSDGSSSHHQILADPLWNNLLLLLGFGLQHSGMPRGPLKNLLCKVLSEGQYRLFYVAATSAYLTAVLYFWAPMNYAVWDVQDQYIKMFVYGLYFLTGLGYAVSLLTLDPLELLGIRAPLNKVLGRKSESLNLVTTGMYGQVRHPTYSFLILNLWATPKMTVGHLLISLIFTGYILIAVAHFEEPDLVRAIGPEYVEYAKRTPRYIPHLFKTNTKKD